jgi:hypothetical protein
MIWPMAIVIRKQGGKWEKTEKVIFAGEAQLQKLLYQSPELIPETESDATRGITAEQNPPGGFSYKLDNLPRAIPAVKGPDPLVTACSQRMK